MPGAKHVASGGNLVERLAPKEREGLASPPKTGALRWENRTFALSRGS